MAQFSAQSRKLLVTANQSAHSVLALDAQTFTLVARVDTLPEPHMVVFDPKRKLLYVAITYRSGYYDEPGPRGSEIAVIDAVTWQQRSVVDIAPYAGPHDLFVREDKLYVTCESHGGCVVVIDVDSYRVDGHIPTETPGPHWLSVLPDGSKAYTGNKEAEFVSVLDLRAGEMIGKIPTPNGSEDLEVASDGRLLYVNDRAKPLLHIISTWNDTEIDAVELPHNPHRLHLTASGLAVVSHYLVPWNSGEAVAGAVSVVDTETRRVIAQVGVGVGPLGIESDPEATRIYVDNAADGTMSVIDAGAFEVIEVAPLEGGAHEVIYLEVD
ncbi:YncE family protein [Nocardia panacis]|uniref:YncE family protein n=1 Tax=Nocardia panacis TaxID=2340916 RepID=A0A3A4KGB3_9NOCA|nr:YncE family protein [Nocardia panacis]RJO73489.1 YncE family protein [Nocardia panacis]